MRRNDTLAAMIIQLRCVNKKPSFNDVPRTTDHIFLTSNPIHHIQLSLVTSVDDEKEKSGGEVKRLGRLSLENQLTSRISCVSLKNCLVYLFVSCFVINLHSRLLVSEIKK